MKKLLVIPIFLLPVLLMAQLQVPIVYGESFIDTDPGFGQATPFPAFTPDTAGEFVITPNLNSLNEGIHTLYVRVRDSLGRWSHTYRRNFIYRSIDPRPISYLEYFWDTDPGYGNAQSVNITPDDSVAAEWSLVIDALSPGVHQLFVRFQDNRGVWSQTVRRNTLLRSLPDAPIEKLDYDFEDSGGQILSYSYQLVTPQHYIDMSFDPDVGDLTEGETYRMCIRAVATDGKESFDQCVEFEWEEDSSATSINMPEAGWLSIYPNPTEGLLHIEMTEPNPDDFTITLANPSGQTLKSLRYSPSTAGIYQLDLTSYSSGMYLLIIEKGNQLHFRKIIKR